MTATCCSPDRQSGRSPPPPSTSATSAARVGATPQRSCPGSTTSWSTGPRGSIPTGTRSTSTPRTGVDDVISALAEIDAAELVVAGGPQRSRLADDPEVTRLRAHARRLGVADRIDWRGSMQREDVPALLRSADVVVCAPWYEPFGIVPVEAAACGVPVVATAVGGMLDTVDDGVTGLRVPPRRPAALASALRQLLADPVRRMHMGRMAARRAHRRYGWERIAAQTLDCYGGLGCAHTLAGIAS